MGNVPYWFEQTLCQCNQSLSNVIETVPTPSSFSGEKRCPLEGSAAASNVIEIMDDVSTVLATA